MKKFHFVVSKGYQGGVSDKSKSSTIAECKIRFLNHKANVTHLSPKTISSYEGEINRFIRFLPKRERTLIHDVTNEDLERYIAYANVKKRKWEDHPFNSKANINQIGLKGTSVNNMRRYLSTFFNYLVEFNFIETSPVAKLKKIPEEKKGDGFQLDNSEVYRLVHQPRDDIFNQLRDSTMLQVLVDTAMRIDQCLGLKVENVILEKNLIQIPPELNKTNKGRYAAITEGTAHMLKRLIGSMVKVTSEDFPWLWITECGTKLSESTFSKQLKKYAKKAGLDPKRIHPHALRTYSAIQHRKNGASIDEIQALLDHESILTTMIYLGEYEHDMRAINNKYSPAHELNKKPGTKKGKIEITLKREESADFENIA